MSMKKIIALAFLLSCFGTLTALAANGDIAGHIYSTDIRAYINGVEVPSYNIGGKTAVVIEDITTDSSYYDDLRTLAVGSFNPEYITEGKSEQSDIPGQIIGDIYETDIKTYMYDTELPAYNIGGKTAVAIEDLGCDKNFSELGGRYFWNGDTRTISLEMLYHNVDMEILYHNQADIKLTVNEEETEADAVFYSDKFSVGGNIEYSDSLSEKAENKQPVLIPVMTEINGSKQLLGYCFAHGTKYFSTIGYDTTENGEILDGGKEYHEESSEYISLCYFYDDVLKSGAETVRAPELTAADKVLRDYILNHNCQIQDRLDTNAYTFAYLSQGTPHGTNSCLLLIQNDGTYHNYWEDFESVSIGGTKRFDNVTIDRENEKCRFRYDTDYEIDLKTGEMKAL